jgi:hypothetical protein
MNKTMYRATSVGLAFAEALAKAQKGRSSIPPDQAHWIERKVADNMEHTQIGVKKERSTNAKLTFKTAKRMGLA